MILADFLYQAYITFTLDKVIGALVKQVITSSLFFSMYEPNFFPRQVQTTLADTRCLELLENLRRERQLPAPNQQDQLNYRGSAQHIVGLEENLFRIEWVCHSGC